MANLSDLNFENYEALYKQELYREKAEPIWASEHERGARRKVYEAIIAECSTPSPEGEPTEEMLNAGIDAFMAAAKEQANAVGRVPQSVALKAAYKAMLTAAYDKGVKK
jgi:hypothetical protein